MHCVVSPFPVVRPVCGEDIEVVERFTYLGSDIHVSAGCESDVNRRLGRFWGVMDSMVMGCGTAGTWREGESPSLQVLGASSLAQWM